MYQDFLWISPLDLTGHELRQLQDEEKEIPQELKRRLTALAQRGEAFLKTPAGQDEAAALLAETIALPQSRDSRLHEPSDLPAILSARPTSAPVLPAAELSGDFLQDKIAGAWAGRVYGCYLGKPVEGLRRLPDETFILESFLKETGQWPLRAYFSLDYPEKILDAHKLNRDWKAGPPFMPEDDDTNYTLIAFAVLRQKGPGFTPQDIAAFWLENLPVNRTYTAERVAYRNLCLNIGPPQSAAHLNPYREWIGAQIRADFFGYAAPGNPQLAAQFAWRDASVSHVKNGLYGAMWVAAMLAAAYVTSDIETIIRAGLAQIPAASRLAAAVAEVLAWRSSGLTFEAAARHIYDRWDEHNFYDWCHTIPNAQICALALLWGEGDYATAISRAVLPGFDTDCNAATVGSIMGMILGAQALPQDLLGRLNDRLESGVRGFYETSISATAGQMAALVVKIND